VKQHRLWKKRKTGKKRLPALNRQFVKDGQ
jgi:hypothetical protein